MKYLLAIIVSLAFCSAASARVGGYTDEEIEVLRSSFERWGYSEKVDELTDEKDMFLHAAYAEDIRNASPRDFSHMTMACLGGDSFRIIFQFESRTMKGEPNNTLQYRIDGGDVETKTYTRHSSRDVIGFYRSDHAKKFVKKLLEGSDEFIVRAPDYSGIGRTAIYQLEDLSEAIKPLREYCKF